METKQICCDESPWPLVARYQSFIDQNLESLSQCGINELEGRRIRGCFHGWVILSDHGDNVLWSLWNPLTSKLIRLPPLVYNEKDSYDCCLSSPPDDQGSVFVLLPKKSPTIVFCLLNRKRKKLKWTKMSYAKQLQSIIDLDNCILQCPACCNGKVYAMTLEYRYQFVIEVDIVVRGKEVVISLLPFVELPPVFMNPYAIYHFLKGTCTELFYIRVNYKYETRMDEVFLFNLDMTSLIWEEMEDLKDDILFVEMVTDDSCSIFYNSVVASEIGGYVNILGTTDKLTSFYLKDRAISTMPIVRESHVLVWAMLECGLEVVRRESKQKEEKDDAIVVRPTNGGETELDSTTSEPHLLNIPFHIL